MTTYHKINTVFKRDHAKPKNPIIMWDWSEPEFEYLAKNKWELTEKVDGTNIRIMWDGQRITFGGKTDNAQIPAPLVQRLNEVFLPQLDKFIEIFGIEGGVCFYGEGYGNRIQKVGKLYRDDQDFVLFDIKIGHWWLQRPDIEDIASKLGIDIVPIIGVTDLHDTIQLVSDGIKSQWGDFEAEGVIAKPVIPLLSRGGKRIITKIKTIDFKNL
jgi:hypothetical protein